MNMFVHHIHLMADRKIAYAVLGCCCRALPVQSAAAELDLGGEVMEGCLSFLQADAVEPYITALPNAAATIDVRFHK
jgi:hypothetical protein